MALLAVACAVVLGCGDPPPPADPAPAQTAASTPSPRPSPTPQTPVPTPAPVRGSVGVLLVKEPNDYAHRNYCGSGATQVLLSAFMRPVPDIETVARAAKLDPNRGQTGANTVAAVNSLLAPVVLPVLGHDRYAGTHVTSLDPVVGALRTNLLGGGDVAAFGHPAPVMLQTMTKTMPGWNGWNATHMITVFAVDLSHGNPLLDTVTYAETPSTVAAYGGPPKQTITLAALWVAMQAFIVESPRDPVNLIS